MEDACAVPERDQGEEEEGDSDVVVREDEDDEEEDLNGPEMRVYTVGELLRNTTQSYHDRGWKTEKDEGEEDSFSSSGSVPRHRKKKQKQQQQAKQSKQVTKEKTRQCRRVWNPEGEYTLVRSGPPLLYEDPDECIGTLTEKSLTIFKHSDPTVVFGEDPKRPLWKGVFRMAVGGYGKDEYYEPKRTHFKTIYAADFPKKNRPADNLQIRRDGVTELPYWVDEWYHAKLAETGHKQKSKKKLQEKSRIEQAEKMGTDKPTILAPVQHVIFHVPDWLEKTVAKKTKGTTGIYPYSLSLVADAAKKTVNLVPSLIARLGPVGTVPVEIPDPIALRQPVSVPAPAPTASVTPASSVTKGKKQPSKKRIEMEEDEEEDDDEEEEAVPAPPPPAGKKVKFTVSEKPSVASAAGSASAVPGQPVPAQSRMQATPANSTQLIRDVMKSFFDAASSGMATPGTFYYQSLAEEGMTYDQFFGPGGPGDCVLPIAQMLVRRLTPK